jgi:alpha-D-ribose 1-methylphosphonate 5-triphosphate diphosphatase
MIQAIGATGEAEGLRADHMLHLRLELTGDDTVPQFERHARHPKLRMISVMDHTPGQRQWNDLQRWRTFQSRYNRWTEAETLARAEFLREAQNRNAKRNLDGILAIAAGLALPMASHDDTTLEHAEEAVALGIRVSEFPTTLAAAQRGRELGMRIIGGAPNLVRGDSHSGNVAVHDLAKGGALDALSSDYVPVSLLHGAFVLHEQLDRSLPDAIATVTQTPACIAGLSDRGAIETGKRADLVRVRKTGSIPAAIAVWKSGQRIA